VVSSRFALSVHILAALTRWPEEPLTSDFLAGSIGTNPVVVRRLLGNLRQAGLIEVTSGPKGGARLRLPAERIDLGTVYRAVELGEVLALHRHPPNPACPVGRGIGPVLGAIFGEAERAMEQTLAKTTLADIAAALAAAPA
jgi:DNA-binding IscR family transcriptional regulator